MSKQVIIDGSIGSYHMIETPMPVPQDKEVVIKGIVSGTNPKDWKYPLWKNQPQNSGDDIAGIVYSVGRDVYEFKPRDRVAAFHECETDNGSFAEYAVAPDHTTFHLPHNTSFEEGATVPLAALTAAIALFHDMKLPAPYDSGTEKYHAKTPLLIYGISSAVGAFAAKLARLSGISPIIGVAGRAGEFAKPLADYVVDYREGEDALVSAIEKILIKEGLSTKLPYVFDAISESGSLEATLRYIKPNGGVVSTVLPVHMFAKDKENFKFPPGVRAVNSKVPNVHTTEKDFGYVWSRYLSRLLEDGRLTGHPYEIIPGGLHGVLTGLKQLRDGKASAVKYVYRIEDTADTPVLQGNLSTQIHEKYSGERSGGSTHELRNFPGFAKK